MSAQRGRRRLIFEWKAPKGIIATTLFLLAASLLEYLVVWVFQVFGLTEKSAFTCGVSVLNVAISPLFHLMPLGVFVVLVSSWVYLTTQVAAVPYRAAPKRPSPRLRERYKLSRFKRFSAGVGRGFRKAGQPFKALHRRIDNVFLRVRGVLQALERLLFARATVRSAAVILSAFFSLFLMILFAEYPGLIHSAVIGFYIGNPSFHGFVLSLMNGAQSLAQALFPLAALASAINGILMAVAPGFRKALEGLGTYVLGPFVQVDLVGKYVICQNAAAGFSAVATLAYGRYVSARRRYKVR